MGGTPDSLIHRLPAHVKLVCLFVFILAVVATPQAAMWAHGLQALLLLAVVLVSRIPLRQLARRMLIEVPFVVFAVLLPFIATGPRTQLGPFTVSEPGLTTGVALLAKATLGVVAALTFAATTEPRAIVAAFETLRLPSPLVQIMSFMLRYTEVIADELRRMRIARESRGFSARSVRQWPALASTLGALFIRSYERGERVHLAMLSRGYTGTLPVVANARATGAQWTVGGILPVAAVAVCVMAIVVTP